MLYKLLATSDMQGTNVLTQPPLHHHTNFTQSQDDHMVNGEYKISWFTNWESPKLEVPYWTNDSKHFY